LIVQPGVYSTSQNPISAVEYKAITDEFKKTKILEANIEKVDRSKCKEK
jgi:hypothetical protein